MDDLNGSLCHDMLLYRRYKPVVVTLRRVMAARSLRGMLMSSDSLAVPLGSGLHGLE